MFYHLIPLYCAIGLLFPRSKGKVIYVDFEHKRVMEVRQ